ncbi:MAG: hypothetical protein Q7K57_12810 [Burkholderiaceae bacterium]|nr:hypothetical protein [Burkholderiaceae bacterium]
MKQFAKIFESPKYGQILFVIDQGDDLEPVLRCSVQPPDMGICSHVFGFENDSDGHEKAEKAFENLTLELAETAAKAVFELVTDWVGDAT